MSNHSIDELYLERPGKLALRRSKRVPSLAANEARVELIYGGICGSDLKVYSGAIPYASYPCRPGHEILGTITESGIASELPPGTRVVSFPNTYCSKCEFCAQGKTNICIEKQSFGVTINGLFASEITIDSKFLVPVPTRLSDERAILTEPLAVVVHALAKAEISDQTSVAVIGCGTEGLLTVALLNHIGANVTVIDINPEKMTKAKLINDAIQTIEPANIREESFEVVIEAAGAKSAIETAFKLVKAGGTLVTLGITGEEVLFPSLHVTRAELTVHGSIIYTKNDFTTAMNYLGDENFDISPILSMTTTFNKSLQAFADAASGNFSKIIIDFRRSQDTQERGIHDPA